MKLKILGDNYKKSLAGKHYRGVERPSPSYAADFGKNHPINQIYFDYLNRIDKYGMIGDFEFCQQLVAQYEKVISSQNFEIVELTNDEAIPDLKNSCFLGFDVACVYRISLLSWGLQFRQADGKKKLVDFHPLLRLIESYFKPKLNDHGLFNQYGDASFFLDLAKSIQKLEPNFWEGDDCKFKVLGVWKVND